MRVMRNKRVRYTVLVICLSLAAGCGLSPDLVRELAKDDASICVTTDIRGGTGALGVGAGGYGQGTTVLCRSKFPNARVKVAPDGSMSIEHGEGIEK